MGEISLLLSVLLIGGSGGERQGSLSVVKTPLAGGHLSLRHSQVGSFAGEVHLSNDNAGILR